MKMDHVILAGPTRTGTTSLFRYFQQCQEFNPSNIKETNYFIDGADANGLFSIDAYHDLFRSRTGARCFLEASPKYFLGGRDIARRIKCTLDNVKVIVTLRDPVERFISLYVHIVTKRSMDKGLPFDEFVEKTLNYQRHKEYIRNDLDLLSYCEGCYCDLLPEWVDAIGGDNLKVVFFEDIVASKSALVDIFQWLGVPCESLSEEEYLHENKATFYRNKLIHKAAMSFNDFLEPFFNKHQKTREFIRDIYYSLNGKDHVRQIKSSGAVDRLRAAYQPKNRELKQYLGSLGCLDFPEWLEM